MCDLGINKRYQFEKYFTNRKNTSTHGQVKLHGRAVSYMVVKAHNLTIAIYCIIVNQLYTTRVTFDKRLTYQKQTSPTRSSKSII